MGKEIHNPLESREEVTSRVFFCFYSGLMPSVMGVYCCRFGASDSLGLESKPGCSSGGPHTKFLGTSFRILQESWTQKWAFVLFWLSALIVYKLLKFHALIVLRKMRDPDGVVPWSWENWHSMVHLSKISDSVRALLLQSCCHLRMKCEYLGKDAKITECSLFKMCSMWLNLCCLVL